MRSGYTKKLNDLHIIAQKTPQVCDLLLCSNLTEILREALFYEMELGQTRADRFPEH